MSEIRVHVVQFKDRKDLVLRYECPITRRRVTKSAGTSNRKEAQRKAGQWEAELAAGQWQPGGRTSWESFRELFMDRRASDLRLETVKEYDTAFNKFESLMRPRSVADLTTQAISKFRQLLESSQVKRRGQQRQMSPATVGKIMRHLKGIAYWAHDEGMLAQRPRFEMPRQRKGVGEMKGRPLRLEEVERMLSATAGIVGEAHARSWQFLLRGLLRSGLRLGEALQLRWDHQPGGCSVRLNGDRSVLLFDSDAQKSGRAETVPMAPEFVRLLRGRKQTHGYVFNPELPSGRATHSTITVGRVICRIGARAGVIVDPETGKTASAHDLRRTFGERWAKKLPAAKLQELMRHASVATTLKYYAGKDAEETAAWLWSQSRIPGHKSGHKETRKARKPRKK